MKNKNTTKPKPLDAPPNRSKHDTRSNGPKDGVAAL